MISITPYIGQFLLLGSLMTSLIYLLTPNRFSCLLYKLQLSFITIAFFWLIYAHLISDFSFYNVVQHSHTDKPWIYKLAGTWGNHEGSMLLWTLLLCWTGWIAFKKDFQGLTLYSIMTAGFVLFLSTTCDPFAAVQFIPENGNDLNPLLQDPLLAIHPPFLYLGYITTSVLFTYAVLGIKSPKLWQKWSLISWVPLTIGLGLGSFWAYYELGWGGWWFWDPVENVALVPWLLLTALMHSLFRGPSSLGISQKWLGYSLFASCLCGTFIVRSGFLTSVHSFALSPERGIFLGILITFILIPSAWMIYRSQKNESSYPTNYRTLLLTGGLGLLILGSLIVVFGTIYPLILEVFHQSITVGSPYFNATFIPITLPILALMALQYWATKKKFAPQTLTSLLSATILITLLLFFKYIPLSLSIIPLLLGIWLVLSSLHYLFHQRTLKALSMVLAHSGLGFLAIGATLTATLETESLVSLKEGQTTVFQGQNITLDHLEPHKGPNYMCQRAILDDHRGHKLCPEKRFYWTQGIIHNETAIQSDLFHHLYITLGERYDDDSWSLRIHMKPWINLLWLGMILMAIGGSLGLYRRLKLSIIFLFFISLGNCYGLEVHEQLPNKILEKRAIFLGNQLICPTCAGQTLNDSVADEAILLREIIRQKLLHGESDQQITDWFINRYGERVLLTPPIKPMTYFLWGFPWILLCLFLIRFYKNNKAKLCP